MKACVAVYKENSNLKIKCCCPQITTFTNARPVVSGGSSLCWEVT